MTPMEKKLARRIHNQRVALRENYQIVEMRADYERRKPLRTQISKLATKHYREAREAKETLNMLAMMICLMFPTPTEKDSGDGRE